MTHPASERRIVAATGPTRPSAPASEPAATPGARVRAWAVHALTASGALVAVAALAAVGAGDLQRAALWMLVALVIDSADGSLARAARVERVLPGIDGRRLDDLVDFLNYVIVPALFLLEAQALWHPAWVALPVLASAYGFSQREAKTDDDFFLGFPSYWNLVALYAWALQATPAVTTAVVMGFSVLVFVPLKYLYPSKMTRLRRSTLGLGLVWFVALVVVVAFPEWTRPWRLAQISLAFPVYYLVLSLALGGWARRRP